MNLRSSKRVDRMYGTNIWGRPNSPIEKRKNRLGQHGAKAKRKISNYGVQLIEKQKIRVYYNMSEHQFKNLFASAMSQKKRTKLDPGVAMIALLESRLDQVIYKARLAPSIFAARQLVTHKHFTVDGKVVNVPSYSVEPGQVVDVRDSSKNLTIIKQTFENNKEPLPSYLKHDGDFKITVLKTVENLEEVPMPFVPHMQSVVEKYSRLV